MEVLAETTDFSEIKEIEALPDHLRQVIQSYIDESKYLSVSGFSKKCGVSEPTIRRILTGKIKTLPQVSTVLDILSYVSGETSGKKLVEMYPGPIAEYLKDRIPQLESVAPVYNPALNKELENQVKYIIFKLASNDSGVKAEKLLQLYGKMGEKYLEELVGKGFLTEEDGVYRSVFENFSADLNQFVNHFKATADFLKVRVNTLQTKENLKPVLANYSCEVSKDQYKRIEKVQAQALKKIREIMTEEGHEGELPVFLLTAFDTLDLNTASELIESSES
ncbi:MAG: hypothetical protein HRT45_01970 [Bdellovibrionales bacterium]|nr:hypothetical protein [Bdellovibrionales bacterium]